MPIARRLLERQITFSEAKKEETTNILQELTYVTLAASFRDHIEKNSATIKAIVAHHLYLIPASYRVEISDRSEWLSGSFNLCVPVSIQSQKQKDSWRVLMRFPLPYKVAGPENGDEKIRCEAATYAWLNQECPNIPTACLHGFGLSTGQRFTAVRNAPFWTRCFQYLRRQILSLFQHPVPCQYMKHQTSAPEHMLGIGYLLLDYVNDGEMLSHSYAAQNHDTILRKNLFRDLAKIQLSLLRKPFPRIGSLTINNDAILTLNNRSFTLEVCQLANDKIPVEAIMPQGTTYTTVDTYIHDILSLHDSRLRYQPNGASSIEDCISQMCALATMRTVYSDFFDRKLRSGPFVLTLTDMHGSNFFVDDEWHITKLLDLEWACVRPIEMQHPPYWLTSQSVDRINEEQYSQICTEFIDIFEEEEKKMVMTEEQRNGKDHNTAALGNDMFPPLLSSYAELLKSLWNKGTFWYCLALDSPTGLHHIFYNRIRPRYQIPYDKDSHEEVSKFDSAFYIAAPTFWSSNAWHFMVTKAEDKKRYDEQLLEVFQAHSL
ncbi:hypothetical protein ACO22_05916 [Paracoccidioides brasiliensis]|uniref:Aminoglycoside phosphotransferase domain-containing protein n=1 Tax=Paracoccidioides brasiliensis TaxID=121759 RepID=A0A1D2J8X4_PARBR|nr:hypothetical protein ACO22_05916 [Paracoccidioides brasiliensis]